MESEDPFKDVLAYPCYDDDNYYCFNITHFLFWVYSLSYFRPCLAFKQACVAYILCHFLQAALRNDKRDAKIRNLLYSQDAKLSYRGYHTIEFDTPVDVTDYAIVITYPDGAPVEGESIDFKQLDTGALTPIGKFEYKTVSEKGQTFVYIGDNWKDMTDSDIKDVLKIDFEPNNCCIKAIYK